MRRAARFILGGSVLAFAAFAGCGGPTFVVVPDGQDGAAADASVTDAAPGVDSSLPPPVDASRPPDARDASAPTDAGDAGDVTTGGDAGADAAAFNCASLAGPTLLLCTDFDEDGGAPPWNWAIKLATAQGAVAVDPVDFVSPPNGFSSTTQALGDGGFATFASLEQSFSNIGPVAYGRVDYAFDMLPKSYDGTVTVPLARLRIGATGALFLDLLLDKGHLVLGQSFTGSDGGSQSLFSVMPYAVSSTQWAHVEMLLDRRAAAWKLSIFIDGVSQLPGLTTAATTSDPTLTVDLGILDVVPPSARNEVAYDNVALRAF